VAGVVGRHECALSYSVDQRPVVVGLEPVVVRAEPVEQVVDGEVGLGPVLPVVVAEAGTCRAACGLAGGLHEVERGLLVAGGAATVVADADDLLALGEQTDEEAVAADGELLDDRDRHRSPSGDLAALPVDGNAAQQRVEVSTSTMIRSGAPGSRSLVLR
jgi:hypothetical protein